MDDPDAIQEQWTQIREKLKHTWDRLSYADLARENGNRDYVIAKVQEYYGYDRAHAENLVRDFEGSLGAPGRK